MGNSGDGGYEVRAFVCSHDWEDIDKPLDAHKEKESVSPQTIDDRDPEVSDEVWSQLQSDKQAADLASRFSREETLDRERKLEQAREAEQAQAAQVEVLAKIKAKNDAEIEEIKRKREKARLEEQMARRARENALAELERARFEEEERRRQKA